MLIKIICFNLAASFLKICHQNDPELNKCIKKSVDQLRPLLVNGISEFGIPSLEPLIIPELIIDQGSGAVAVKSTYTDIKVYGASVFNLRSVKWVICTIKYSQTKGISIRWF